jgi:hypothetical protein
MHRFDQSKWIMRLLMQRIITQIKNNGWKGLYVAVVWKIMYGLRHLYIYFLRNHLVSRLFPFRQPTILLLSFPRSGSSWAGEILSYSQNVTYMFEPITRPYQKYQAGYAMADLDDPEIFQKYLKYSQEAFQGWPPKQIHFSERLYKFSIFGRKQRQLLIKEVNPRAAELYTKNFHPNVLFLVRHPAAVALSFWERGWLESPDVKLYGFDFNGNEWEKFGYAYGIAMKSALDSIKKYSCPYKIIAYEELASDPFVEFQKIFEYLQVELPQEYQDIIDEYCYTDESTQGYKTRRVSSTMIEKWKKKLSPESIIDLHRGYLQSSFDYYISEDEWEFCG